MAQRLENCIEKLEVDENATNLFKSGNAFLSALSETERLERTSMLGREMGQSVSQTFTMLCRQYACVF